MGWRPLVATLAGLLAGAPGAGGDAPPEAERVTRAALLAAMRAEAGYDRRATTNQARFQARVLLALAREARARRPEGPPLFIDHADWFQAYLEALELPAEAAPPHVRLAFEQGSDGLVEHRPERVLERVLKGPSPALALNVRWRARRPDGSYSYEDLQARPPLKVSVAAVLSHRLLEFERMLVYDEIDGLSGRPLGGVLAFFFRLVGEAQADWSRSATADDGWQVVVGRGHKGLLSASGTVTLRPDGSALKDVPAGRPDLRALEARLKEPLEVVYRPLERRR